MQAHPVARAYAEALLEIAQERQKMDEFGDSLSQFASILQSEADLRLFFAAPTIDPEAKKRSIRLALQESADPVVIDFLSLLVDRGRLMAVDQIAAAYCVLADEVANRRRVQATSAAELTVEVQDRLRELLNKQLNAETLLETKVDPDLLGGMVLRIGDKVFDGSVRGQLQRVGRDLMRSSGYEN